MNVASLSAKSRLAVGLVRRAVNGLNRLLSVVCAFWLLGLMVLICLDVASRFFINRPISGVAEFVSLSIVACLFLQLPSLIAERRLLRAEIVIAWLESYSRRAAHLFNFAFAAVGAVISAKIVQWSGPVVVRSWQEGEFAGSPAAYQIPVWPFKVALFFGALIAVIQFAGLVWSYGSALFAGRDLDGRGDPSPRLRTGYAEYAGFAIALAAIALIALLIFYLFSAPLRPIEIGVWCIVAMLPLVLLGMPIPLVLMGLSYIGIWAARGSEFNALNTLGIAAWSAVGSYEFGTIPLFIMMGVVLHKADVGQDAYRVAAALLGRLRGGLGMATVFANAIFASIVGSSVASAAVFSKIAVPSMVQHGYTKQFSVGCVAGSSVLGMLIPPSLLLIIYGLIAEESVGKLFIAAIVPGLILAFAFALGIYAMARLTPALVAGNAASDDSPADPLGFGEGVLKLAPIALLVAAVIGGIYGGIFSPTEASAVGTLFALLIALARRRLSFSVLREILLETATVAAIILFLIVAANLYTRNIALTGLPSQFAQWVENAELPMHLFLAVYFIVVLVLGMIIDSVSILLIVLPITLPMIAALGGDKIWFGIVTTVIVEIGLLTPPFGLAVYVVKSALPQGFASLKTIFVGTLPFVMIMILVSGLLMAFPTLSLMFVR